MTDSRDVVYRLQAIQHPDNDKTFRDFGTEASKAYDRIQQRAQASVQAQLQFTNRFLARTVEDYKKLAADRLNQISTEERAFESAEKKKRQAMRDTSQAQELAAGEARKATEQLGQSAEEIKTKFGEATEGILTLAEGAALLAISGEEDLQKLLQSLVQLRATFNVIRGSMETVSGLVGLYKALAAAIASATAAETARQAVASRGLAVVGLGAVSGLAGAAAIGSIATAGAMIGNVGGIRDTSAAAFERSGMFEPGTLGSRFFGGQAQNRQALASARRAEAAAAARETRLERDQALAERLAFGRTEFDARLQDAGRDAEINGDARGANEARIRAAREELSRLKDEQAELNRLQSQGQVVLEREAELREQSTSVAVTLRDLTEERLTLERQAADDLLRAAQNRLAVSKDELAAAQTAADLATSRLQSDLERFAQLSQAEQKGLFGVRAKVNAGAQLTDEEARLASQFAEFRDDVRNQRIAQAQAAGAGQIFTAGLAAQQAAQSRLSETERLVVERRDEVRVIIERNDSEIAKILDSVREALQLERTEREQQLAGLREATNQRAAQTQNARTAAIGGR